MGEGLNSLVNKVKLTKDLKTVCSSKDLKESVMRTLSLFEENGEGEERIVALKEVINLLNYYSQKLK